MDVGLGFDYWIIKHDNIDLDQEASQRGSQVMEIPLVCKTSIDDASINAPFGMGSLN